MGLFLAGLGEDDRKGERARVNGIVTTVLRYEYYPSIDGKGKSHGNAIGVGF
jgi:hypothetical protein